METDLKTLQLADRMLAGMGLDPVTVPQVLNGNRVPDFGTEICFRAVESFLLKHKMVTEVKPAGGKNIPGGWQLLQLNDRGYSLVQNGLSVVDFQRRQRQQAYEQALQEEQWQLKWQKKRQVRQEAIDSGELPRWWLYGGGERLIGDYDPKEEQPLWWAKYRLRRMRLLAKMSTDYAIANNSPLNEEPQFTFPHRWWEKILEFFFRNTGIRAQIILPLLLLAGLVYLANLLFDFI